jgi:hypothetical protein
MIARQQNPRVSQQDFAIFILPRRNTALVDHANPCRSRCRWVSQHSWCVKNVPLNQRPQTSNAAKATAYEHWWQTPRDGRSIAAKFGTAPEGCLGSPIAAALTAVRPRMSMTSRSALAPTTRRRTRDTRARPELVSCSALRAPRAPPKRVSCLALRVRHAPVPTQVSRPWPAATPSSQRRT